MRLSPSSTPFKTRGLALILVAAAGLTACSTQQQLAADPPAVEPAYPAYEPPVVESSSPPPPSESPSPSALSKPTPTATPKPTAARPTGTPCHPGAGALAFTRDAASRHTESFANRSANAHCCADSGSQPHDSYADAASSCLASDCCVVCSVQPGPHDSGDRQPGLNQHHWAADTAERRSLVGRSNGHQSSGNNGCA